MSGVHKDILEFILVKRRCCKVRLLFKSYV